MRATETTHGSSQRPPYGSTSEAVSRARSVADPTAIPTSASARHRSVVKAIANHRHRPKRWR